MSRPADTARRLLTEDHLSVGAYEPGETMTYWDANGHELARVRPADDEGVPIVDLLKDHVAREPAGAWDVTDRHGVVFSLRRYEGADHPSYDVIVDGDRVLGTFFVEGGLIHQHVVVRDDAAAPVAEIETHRRVHELRERHGERLAACRRTVDPLGNDVDDEVWSVDIEPHVGAAALDRRVLIAAPLVCHLIGHPKRTLDPDSEVAQLLLITFPPAGAVLLAAERVMDGLYWMRRKLD